jgi:hypothetical protein
MSHRGAGGGSRSADRQLGAGIQELLGHLRSAHGLSDLIGGQSHFISGKLSVEDLEIHFPPGMAG